MRFNLVTERLNEYVVLLQKLNVYITLLHNSQSTISINFTTVMIEWWWWWRPSGASSKRRVIQQCNTTAKIVTSILKDRTREIQILTIRVNSLYFHMVNMIVSISRWWLLSKRVYSRSFFRALCKPYSSSGRS